MNKLREYKKNREKNQYLKRKIREQENEILRLRDMVDNKEAIIRKMAIDHSKKEIDLLNKLYKEKTTRQK